MFLKKALLIMISLMFFSCIDSESSLSFIKENNQTDFRKYKGYGVFRRGQDDDMNIINYVFKISNSELDSEVRQVVTKIILDSTNHIVFVDSSRLVSGVDTLREIVSSFNLLNIHAIRMNPDGLRVYFSLSEENMQYELMKIEEGLPSQNIDRKKWKKLREHWYLKR